MDRLFKRLAYELIPLHPQCLEPGPSHPVGASRSQQQQLCADCSVQSTSTAVLSIGVACVCSDVQSAEAVVHFLTCIGFSTTFLPTSDYTDAPAATTGEYPAPPSASRPLTVVASWPLSTDRLPPIVGSGVECPTATHVPLDGQVRIALLSAHQVCLCALFPLLPIAISSL